MAPMEPVCHLAASMCWSLLVVTADTVSNTFLILYQMQWQAVADVEGELLSMRRFSGCATENFKWQPFRILQPCVTISGGVKDQLYSHMGTLSLKLLSSQRILQFPILWSLAMSLVLLKLPRMGHICLQHVQRYTFVTSAGM